MDKVGRMADATRPSQAEPTVSALRASVPCAVRHALNRASTYVDGTIGRLDLNARNEANDDDLREWSCCLAGDLRLAQLAIEEAAEASARRDENERRNCLNWGPCSRHDGRMSEDAIAIEAQSDATGTGAAEGKSAAIARKGTP